MNCINFNNQNAKPHLLLWLANGEIKLQIIKDKIMFTKGQKVQQEFSNQVMEVIGFQPELIENVITQWKDKAGTIITGKFMESQLTLVDDKSRTKNQELKIYNI